VRSAGVWHRRVEGLADTGTRQPLTEDSIFYIGSIAKQFVAACALLLADDGELDLDAPVGSIVEDLPPWADDVRVRHLVHHTSGLRDRDHTLFPGVPVTGVPARSNDDELAQIRSIEHLASPPGASYRYANRGYHLLGQAVARASGSSRSPRIAISASC